MKTPIIRGFVAAAIILTGSCLHFTHSLVHSRGWSSGYAAGVREERSAWILVSSRSKESESVGVLARRDPRKPLLSYKVDVRPTPAVNNIAEPFPPFER